MRKFSNHTVLLMSDSTMAVSSKYTQDLSVQIIFFTFSCKWLPCFYFWAVIWSYIVDLFAALHELASASAHITRACIIGMRALKTLWRHLKRTFVKLIHSLEHRDSPRQSRWNHSTEHIGLSQAIISPLLWPQKQNTSFPTEDRYHFSQKHINTARLPWYSLQCDLCSCDVLLQWLSLHVLFIWWTYLRHVEATFQHLQIRVFPLQVLEFLHQIDINPFSQLSSVPQQ